MTFRPSNESGRGRTESYAGRILIPHRLRLWNMLMPTYYVVNVRLVLSNWLTKTLN